MASDPGTGKEPDDGRHGPSDDALVRRVQEGDREAFGLLAGRYLRPVHAVAASFLGERADVEDVAQEAFLRALRAIRTFDPTRPFAPWLYQIARNVARNRLKRMKRHATDPVSSMEESLADPGASPAAGAERSEIRTLLTAAIEELPERRRIAFRLADVDGYPATEVARLMGLTPGAVRAHIHHARRDLRARLAPLLKEGDGHEHPR
ncbi:MAG TPA: sigma-70 family RNA polymerase sigma factor [Longimicrobiales bacterium]|nr:sigma-70 family RNA polymerase sigma factor [Longimicrobiales bacterium]